MLVLIKLLMNLKKFILADNYITEENVISQFKYE